MNKIHEIRNILLSVRSKINVCRGYEIMFSKYITNRCERSPA